jgi:hypothetical protein
MSTKVSKSEQEYRDLIKSGMFWEFYPGFSGAWEQDKTRFEIIWRKLEYQRKFPGKRIKG